MIDIERLTQSVEPRLSQVERLRHAVTSDPAICSGEPLLRGTRHRVYQVAALKRQGVADKEFAQEFGLTSDQIATGMLYGRLHHRLGRPSPAERLLRNVVEHVPDRR